MVVLMICQEKNVDNLLAECDHHAGKYDGKDLGFAKQALNLANDIQYDIGIFESHFRIARSMMSRGSNEDAIQHLDICYSIAQTLELSAFIARTANSFGIAYYNLGVISKSLEHFIEALDISKANQFLDIQCRVYNNICTILSELGDYQTALDYLNILLEKCANSSEEIFPKCIVYRNLAHTLYCMNDIKSAESYALKALARAINRENLQILCESYYLLGEIKTCQKRYTEADEYFMKALALAEETSNDYYIVQIRSNLSKLYCEMHSYNNAYSTALYAYNYAKKLNHPLLKRNAALILAEVCKLNNNSNTNMLIEALTVYKDITRQLEDENLKRQQAFTKAQLMLYNLKKDNERLRVEIERDPLTGCLSSRTFPDRIIKSLSIYGKKGALIFLDIDNLKSINDAYGHDAGDDLLKGFANDLICNLPKEAIRIRLAGDEFIVFLPKAGKSEAVHALDNLKGALSKPHKIGNKMMPVPVSAGIALYPDHSTNIIDLKNMADTAMYSAKQAGRGGYKIYGRA